MYPPSVDSIIHGMPKETAEPIWQESWNPDILPDEFNVVKYWGLKTPEECAERVQTQVQDIYTSKQKETNVSVVAGLVEETLPVQENLKPALYVDFDLDIYSPTKFAFNYMMENNLIVPGTIIGYDDWGGTPGFEEMKDGESVLIEKSLKSMELECKNYINMGVHIPMCKLFG